MIKPSYSKAVLSNNIPPKARKAKNRKRQFVVFAGLLGVLTITSAILLTLSPAPLKPDHGAAMLAANTETVTDILSPLPGVFDGVNVQAGQWQYIYIHHSRTGPGDSRVLAAPPGDHFVIGSGDPSTDGKVEMTSRWVQQVAPIPPTGLSSISPRCISIVLVGDLDQTEPSKLQVERATRLVRTLQQQLNIPAGQVVLATTPDSAVGAGTKFPFRSFNATLLP